MAHLVEIVSTSTERAEVEDRIHELMLQEDFTPGDIHEAVGVLTDVLQKLPVEVNIFRPCGSELADERPLTPREELGMTEEARGLLDEWRAMGVLSRSQLEVILQHSSLANTGELDTAALKELASETAEEGSLLRLLLLDPNTRH
ncbi:MAG: DUF494 family protein [Candidatus Hydrogenedentota bacterium]|nr:MAG: DUF494 family protein [Candidatus Hydrogenedentota bacterium]